MLILFILYNNYVRYIKTDLENANTVSKFYLFVSYWNISHMLSAEKFGGVKYFLSAEMLFFIFLKSSFETITEYNNTPSSIKITAWKTSLIFVFNKIFVQIGL